MRRHRINPQPLKTIFLMGLVGLGLLRTANCWAEQSEVEFFEKKIRPVLIEHCYKCHSEKSAAIKGGLSLDHRQALLEGGDSGPVLVPGKPQESLLISSLKYESYEMPPAGKLPDDVIKDFELWIANGAIDPRKVPPGAKKSEVIDWEASRQFWAFQPIPAEVMERASQTITERTSRIDELISERLSAAKISPNPAASAERRIRRLYYDLIGLPPTPAQILDFVNSPSEEAWSTTVDQLLSSPRFGEKWGRHWLDVARYADSNGGDFNATYHNAWRYRDYVINSYNLDKPIDQFFREQLAGDSLAAETPEQQAELLVATGFLMIGPKMLSERDKVKLKYDVIDEQIDTFGKVFLGLSLGCARCHDHKFDPVPTADYYSLAGIFQGTQVLNGESQQYVSDWLRRDLPTSPEHRASLQQHKQQTADLKNKEQELKAAIKLQQQQVDQLAPTNSAIVIDNKQARLVGEWKSSTFSKPFIGSDYIHDDKQQKGKKEAHFSTQLPAAGKYQVLFAYLGSAGRDQKVPVRIHHHGKTELHFVDQTRKATLQNHYVLLGEYEFAAGTEVTVVVSTENTTGYVIADAVQFLPVNSDAQKLAENEPYQQAKSALALLQEELAKNEKQQAELAKKAPAPIPQAIAVQDFPTCDNCTIMIRGEHTNPGKLVPRGTLKIISGEQATLEIPTGSGRLELANWLVTEAATQAARVYVNRIWMHLLREGLVSSVDNFGTQGIPPTHPELLDELAAQFIKSNWSTKQLVRAIVQTEVYQRSTAHQAAAFQIDPENRLLWRAHRRPLTSEELHDTFVLLCEQLDLKMGGSPVSHLGQLVVDNSASSSDAKKGIWPNRRSVYRPVLRSQLDEIAFLFDFANPELVVGKRPVTNVPSQALFLLNHPETRSTATQLVEEMFQRHGVGSFSGLNDLYLKIFNRFPAAQDDQLLQQYITTKLADSADDAVIRNVWTEVVQALLISTEFRYID